MTRNLNQNFQTTPWPCHWEISSDRYRGFNVSVENLLVYFSTDVQGLLS